MSTKTIKPITSTSKQALWFLIVGASAALVHFLVLVSIVSFTAISPTWANVMAFLIAFIVSFFGHFHLTFRQPMQTYEHTNQNIKQHIHTFSWRRSLPTLIKWFASSAIGFAANQSLFVLGLSWFGERYYILVWIVVTGIITVMSFFLGKLWAFKS
ncbi:GtrA family protein [Psychrobacter alimentarius]|uniref:GtrA family protein n=1 Tax=Psychrobacter alimentarius TaxID=261164 RepID=UPI003FB80C60